LHLLTALFLALLSLTFTGCEDKKSDKNILSVEDTTVILADEQQIDIPQEVIEKKSTQPSEQSDMPITPIAEELPLENDTKEPSIIADNAFVLTDIQQTSYMATINHESLMLKGSTKPIVLLQLFATWCTPCIGEVAYLNDLQKLYEQDLFVAGVLTRDEISQTELIAFKQKHHIAYKILQSKKTPILEREIAQNLFIEDPFSIPLIIMYVQGQYFSHYEGSTPVEMIKHDIKQAKQQIQKNKDSR